ncbi:hypothetical protein IO401_001527, partial [Campylobacter lari]|nr:hypothetical protein [Campylobacter lari]EJV5920612.1 hypothetical protein [Campylobacter lari]
MINKGTIQGGSSSQNNGVLINGNNNTNVTIDNQGSINGKVSGIKNEGKTIESLNNTGTIHGGSHYGIYNNVNGVINTLDNSGTISGKESGIELQNGSTIKTLNNSGTIGSDSTKIGIKLDKSTIENLNNEKSAYIRGIQLVGGSTIKTLENSGVIGAHGIQVNGGSKIDSLVNEVGGQILGSGKGVFFAWNTQVNTFINKGTIVGEGDYGAIVEFAAKVGNINNSGVINSKSSNWNSAGIYMSGGSFKTITNEKSGVILSNKEGIKLSFDNGVGTKGENVVNKGTIIANNSGIQMTNNNVYLKTLENSGTILAKFGLYMYDRKTAGANTSSTLDNFINSGLIQAGQDGVIITTDRDNNSNANLSIGNINNSGTIIANRHGIVLDDTVKANIGTIVSSGTIMGHGTAGSSGIYVSKNSKINQYIQLSGDKSFVAGIRAGIINYGTIGANNNNGSLTNDNTGNVIDLKDGATIAAINNDGKSLYTNNNGIAILNGGVINGNINLNGGSKIIGAIDNKNTIAGNIALNDKSYITSINNEKTIQGSIDLKEKSHIDNIINSGTIVGGIKLDDSTIGSITNNKGGKADLDLKN